MRSVSSPHRDGRRPPQGRGARGGQLPSREGGCPIQHGRCGRAHDQGRDGGAGIHRRVVGQGQRGSGRLARQRRRVDALPTRVPSLAPIGRSACNTDGSGPRSRGAPRVDDGRPGRLRAWQTSVDSAGGRRVSYPRTVRSGSPVLRPRVQGATAPVGQHGPTSGTGHVCGVWPLAVHARGWRCGAAAGDGWDSQLRNTGGAHQLRATRQVAGGARQGPHLRGHSHARGAAALDRGRGGRAWRHAAK
mmetsp:Transcript_11858/g.28770  ORF Transcript_11858/g.28770 Transcript_11858/m.28770 type:complete len:246 (+) Transcript_11858:761-1498(+)